MRNKINFLVGPQEPLLAAVMSRKLTWYEHMSRTTTASTKSSFRAPGGWATLGSAEEMLDGQRQGVDAVAHTRAHHDGLPQNRLEDDLC